MLTMAKAFRAIAAGLLTLGLALTIVALTPATQAVAQELRRDPAKITGPDACGECHKASVAAWKQTHHFSTFKDLPRKKEARDIAKAMGLKRIKAGGDCLTCHFTSKQDDAGDVDPIAGIACESCHGAGKDWINVHSDYGGKGVTAETEDPAHRKERYAKSEAAGMIRPGDLYAVAQNCYSCHTVPNEELVNKGGHAAGSNFELVAWSQGEVRHNVWYSKDNNEAALERRRMMFLVGKALDLEFALRGVAKATQKATYAVAMAKRAARARAVMEEISGLIKAPEIDEIVAASKSAGLKLNNEAELSAAADKVQAAAKKLAANYDGSTFGAIDRALPSEGKYMGKAP